jgi:hypothetical protein
MSLNEMGQKSEMGWMKCQEIGDGFRSTDEKSERERERDFVQ